MGRPWWYDNYWQKEKKPDRKFSIPGGRQFWVWLILVLLALLLTANQTAFHPTWGWLYGFVYYLCTILVYTILARVILSWFTMNRYSPMVAVLDGLTEPIMAPLRRIIPPLGMFDITPIVAVFILVIIPWLLERLLRLLAFLL
ncbi:MAG: YggT family protein [Chloroflexota bacterium]